MEQEEVELCECASCGAEVDPHADRYFALSDQDVLCFECAIDLGGEYDESEDRWLVAPNLDFLADERRPHA
jgi:hypothetical protein